MTFYDGSKYEGGWKADLQNGHGVFSGYGYCHYEGGWKDGKKEGFGVMMYTDGSKYEGGWREDAQYYGNGKTTVPWTYDV